MHHRCLVNDIMKIVAPKGKMNSLFPPGRTGGDERSKDCATEKEQEMQKSFNKQSTYSDEAQLPHAKDPLFGFRWKVTFKFYFSFFVCVHI